MAAKKKNCRILCTPIRNYYSSAIFLRYHVQNSKDLLICQNGDVKKASDIKWDSEEATDWDNPGNSIEEFFEYIYQCVEKLDEERGGKDHVVHVAYPTSNLKTRKWRQTILITSSLEADKWGVIGEMKVPMEGPTAWVNLNDFPDSVSVVKYLHVYKILNV